MRINVKRIFFATLILVFISPVYTAVPSKGFVDGEIIVKYKKKVATSSYRLSGQSIVPDEKEVRVIKLHGQTVEDAVREYSKDGNVEVVQPNYIYRISATAPNDPYYATHLWALNNTGQSIPGASYSANNPGTSGDDMNAEYAWDYNTSCSGVTVAVIDTGVYYTHEDLSANMWNGGNSYPNHGYDFVNSDNAPMDDNGHGTHVAGIIGAAGNNGVGITGVCWSASIMAVKTFDASGVSDTAKIVQGMSFAMSNGAKVMNMSFNIDNSMDTVLYNKISDAMNSDVVVVAAAGNGLGNDGNPRDVDSSSFSTYPCDFDLDNIICVCSVDQKNAIATFSNYGTTSVDVCAPGTNIWSTWNSNNSSYKIENGTSMSTAYVAGLAALVRSYNTSYTYRETRLALMYGAVKVSGLEAKSVSGNVVDGLSAITYIAPPTGITAVINNN